MPVNTEIGLEVGAYVIYEKNNILILLILTIKLYFGDDDAINEVKIQEPAWKWFNKFRNEIIRDPLLLKYYSFKHTQPFSFLEKIERANFAVSVLAPSGIFTNS